ncbi:hypothetical protein [Streptomyces sp. NPDC086989]|uniref:hypothetical protein n=1 Tax=Streptomyces sp. NPDC086989 TaxID=3365764 RepID=UPI003824FFC0
MTLWRRLRRKGFRFALHGGSSGINRHFRTPFSRSSRPGRCGPGLPAHLADVMMPPTMCWEAERVERKRRRVDLAESRTREAMLHLLMAGQLSTAHRIAAGPAAATARQAAPPLDRVIGSTVDDSVVGVSEEVPLRETAAGHEQALHALTVARGRAERRARFGVSPELALVFSGTGANWADSLLEPSSRSTTQPRCS